ncbi:MAG: PEP-CTERM sorting domain-containing protein [Pseudomonadota bacterium]
MKAKRTTAVAMMMSAFCLGANASLLNTELVTNGGAEDGLTGWSTTGIDSVPAVGLEAGFGASTFTGGTGSATQTADQTIDISALAASIDAGLLSSDFRVQLQSRSLGAALDTARARLTYLDGTDNPLGTFELVDTINTDGFDWNLYTDLRAVPVNTRSIQVTITATRLGGASSDGFIDEVSLQVVPEPASAALLAAGCLALGRRRRA